MVARELEHRVKNSLAVIAATHVAYQRFVDAKVDGFIYTSFMSPGGSCFALWLWNQSGDPLLKVVDPDGRLPSTPASGR